MKYGLDALFTPSSAAVIGATAHSGTVGRAVLENLLHGGATGKVYAVNPKHEEVLGLKAYRSIRDIPESVDLAVIVTPAATVPQIIGECVDAGAKSAVVISAGFKERGAEGVALEQEIQVQLRRGSMRLIGPNCLGIMNPTIGLNATFAKDAPRAGSVAFLSQSGALLTAILDWSYREEVGFSAIVSTGSMLDVGWGDLIYHFGDDAAHQEHPPLHGIGGRCAVVLVGGSRSRSHQADYRDQSRPLGSRLACRGFPYWGAHRQRRSSGCCVPSFGSFAGTPYRRSFLYGGSAREATAPQGTAPHHPHQRWRTGSTRHRRAGGEWWGINEALAGKPSPAG